ncbi:sulfotransferase [Myxosarcina sp. GI1]|uniref:sulfotransferase n=1 Tax=Myxosarcina sp. GI1 TaxID=1541065 RepID=UPI00068CFE82|nr:sulfotransferase [Myxosarcina sp. GI1]
MIQWIGAIFLVVGFVILFQLLGLVEKSKNVTGIAFKSLNIIGSPALSDEEKESELQKNSRKLFGLFFILAGGGAIALLLPVGILWIGDRLGWLSLTSVLDTTFSPLFIIISSIIIIVALFFKPKQQRSTAQTSSYSQLDRTLHQLAFNTYTAQIALADAEDALFSKQLAAYQTERPVFITALPRAGTTLLLECCASLPEFASHRYRDMPFVIIPVFWNRFSKIFQQNVETQERAHGDGMKISPDSPEALEETIWKTFWQRHYHQDRIIHWDYEENKEFEEFFRSHLRKIIWLRQSNSAVAPRYVSKNNANIARIAMLKKLFPDSIIIIPFRDPLQHATSLLEQHLNFLNIHESDPFASEYMRAIGHYDFGQNLRPIDFNSWFDERKSRDANSLAFWLEYWVASYEHLLQENADLVNFFDYEALCNSPQQGLKTLAEVVASSYPEMLISSASRIRQPRLKEIDTGSLPASLLQEANLVFNRLQEKAVNSKKYQ